MSSRTDRAGTADQGDAGRGAGPQQDEPASNISAADRMAHEKSRPSVSSSNPSVQGVGSLFRSRTETPDPLPFGAVPYCGAKPTVVHCVATRIPTVVKQGEVRRMRDELQARLTVLANRYKLPPENGLASSLPTSAGCRSG
jgi:hypothetical protein